MSSTRARSKYGNTRVTLAGRTFDSKAEARRYETLCLRERLGEILDIRCQVRIPCAINGVTVCTYVVDFVYEDALTGVKTYEDVKGFRTEGFRLKAKLVNALYGIKIVEIAA